jgi:tetratricopeptide (TPR) repeat protein
MQSISLTTVVLAAALASPQEATTHYAQGRALAQKGDLDGAVSEYRIALRMAPSYADAHYSLAVLLAKKGDRSGAITELRETLRLKPSYAEAHSFLGATLQNAVAQDMLSSSLNPKKDTRLDEAIVEDTKALHLKPDSDGEPVSNRLPSSVENEPIACQGRSTPPSPKATCGGAGS